MTHYTSAFMQLQFSLNRAWMVRADGSGLRAFVGKRLSCFGVLLALSLVVVGTTIVSSWVSATARALPIPAWAMQVVAAAISGLFMSALFAAVFKYVPDAEIEWRDVRVGALATAILFEGGRLLLSVYLGKAGIASVYGAAGSLALILLFVYYASMLLLFGAEFTHVWAKRRGVPIRPSRGAMLIPGAY